jgi:CBS domain-containing protein
MADKEIGAVVVVDTSGVVGMFSERDYARRCILMGRRSVDSLVRDLMTSPVFTVTPYDNLDGCMNLMSNKRIRHLPVVDDGRLIGMISIGDVMQAMIQRQQSFIESLEGYITGSR